MDDRYQHQRRAVRLWRRRHQVLVPYYFLRSFVYGLRRGAAGEPYLPAPGGWLGWARACWMIECGLAHGRMKWYYTLEECRERLP